MVKTILCYYAYAYIHFKGNISVANTKVASAGTNNANKKVIFQNCAPFTDWISQINYTQRDNVKDIDVVMPMYNLMKYNDSYSKKLEAFKIAIL